MLNQESETGFGIFYQVAERFLKAADYLASIVLKKKVEWHTHPMPSLKSHTTSIEP